MTAGPADSLRDAAARLDAAGLIAEIRKPVADPVEAAAVARAVEVRLGKASRFADPGAGGEMIAGVCAGRRRMALALGGPADGLPGWLAARLGDERDVVLVPDAPVAAERVGDPEGLLATLPEGLAGLLVVAGSGTEPAILALTTIRSLQGGRLVLDPIPWRQRRVLRAAAADGRPAALVLGAPPALLYGAALAAQAAGDAYAIAGAVTGAAIPCTLPANACPPVPAEAETAIFGTLTAEEDSAAATLTVAGACSRADPVLHLMTGPDGRELLGLEALAMETALARHVATVEGGVDVIDVVVFPETGNRLAALKIRPRIGGQSKTALMAALSSTALGPEVAIGVDEDINVHDLRDVTWSMASRLHAEIDVATLAGVATGAVDRGPAGTARTGTKWFVDSTMPPLTQPDRRAAFERATPKNLAKVRLEDFLPR